MDPQATTSRNPSETSPVLVADSKPKLLFSLDSNTVLIILGGILGALFLIVLICMICCLLRQRKQKKINRGLLMRFFFHKSFFFGKRHLHFVSFASQLLKGSSSIRRIGSSKNSVNRKGS